MPRLVTSLSVCLYVLRGADDINRDDATLPQATLMIEGCLPFTAQIRDVRRWGSEYQSFEAPVVKPRRVPAEFRLSQLHPLADPPTDREPLTWLPAGEFGKVQLDGHYGAYQDAWAALMYLRVSPQDTPVVLGWIPQPVRVQAASCSC